MRKFIITEEEKNNILKLHRIIFEQTAFERRLDIAHSTAKGSQEMTNAAKDFLSLSLRYLTSKALPLHQYCAVRFGLTISSTLTESEIDKKVIDNLSDILCKKSQRFKKCNSKYWPSPDTGRLYYPDYTTKYIKSPEYGKSSFTYASQPTWIQEIMLSLGDCYVQAGSGGWIITDTFNFDNIMKDKERLVTKNIGEVIKNGIQGAKKTIYSLWQGGTGAGGVEEILSQYHNFGYKGFPVKINVPYNGCVCNGSK